MLGTRYRGSRFCSVLGNPTAYEILKILAQSKKTPTRLAREIGFSLKTVSDTLRNLQQVNLVRYVTRNKNKIYFLKEKSLPSVLNDIEKYVKKMRVIKW